MTLYDAKARFPESSSVRNAANTTITKRGRVVAKVVPAKAAQH